MERKRITKRRETKLKKVEESKMELSEAGYLRRSKSEISFESSALETELVEDRRCPDRVEQSRRGAPTGRLACAGDYDRAGEEPELESCASGLARDSVVGDGTPSSSFVKLSVPEENGAHTVGCSYGEETNPKSRLDVTEDGHLSDTDNDAEAVIIKRIVNLYQGESSGSGKQSRRETRSDTNSESNSKIRDDVITECSEDLRRRRRKPSETAILLTHIHCRDESNGKVSSKIASAIERLSQRCSEIANTMARERKGTDNPTDIRNLVQDRHNGSFSFPEDKDMLEKSVKYLIGYFENIKRASCKQNNPPSEKMQDSVPSFEETNVVEDTREHSPEVLGCTRRKRPRHEETSSADIEEETLSFQDAGEASPRRDPSTIYAGPPTKTTDMNKRSNSYNYFRTGKPYVLSDTSRNSNNYLNNAKHKIRNLQLPHNKSYTQIPVYAGLLPDDPGNTSNRPVLTGTVSQPMLKFVRDCRPGEDAKRGDAQDWRVKKSKPECSAWRARLQRIITAILVCLLVMALQESGYLSFSTYFK